MDVSQRISFTQFIDFLLWSLYAAEFPDRAGEFHDLRKLADNLLVPVDPQWVFDAGKVLESRGLARCAFALGGHVEAMLTGEGRLLAEELLGREGSFVKELLEDPKRFVHWTEPPAETDDDRQSLEEERAPAFQALDELRTAVEGSPLPDADKNEVLADIETIRTQLRKREPHLPIIADLLESTMASGFMAEARRVASLVFVS